MTAALIAPLSGAVSGHDSDRPRAQTHDYRHHQPPGVKYYRSPEVLVERERSEGERDRCLPPVSGLGTQWIGLEGALKAARKDWMERVRYDHGESFVDMSHAANVGSRCGRVSIGQFLGRVMYRCEVIARPCKAQFEPGEATKAASLAAPETTAAPTTTAPLPAATPAPTRHPLAIFKLLKLPLRHYRPAPALALPADTRPPSLRLAALFMGHIVMDALGTMDLAPTSAITFTHKLLNAAFEFPLIYRALSISTMSPD